MLEIIEHGAIRELRINRPPANAINAELAAAMKQALTDAAAEARAVVVSGRPGMFSAGLDVPELLQLDRQSFAAFWQGFLDILQQVASMPIPVAFALTGHAPAGGIVLALFGDYRIMPRGSFKTGLNEVQIGLVVPIEAHRALARLVGPHAAERLIVRGDMIPAEKALEIGLVDELADDPEGVVQQAIEWCEQHVTLPPDALAATRRMARSDLLEAFAPDPVYNLDFFVDGWFSDAAQATLKGMVERLQKK